jgi:hypothetical protein
MKFAGRLPVRVWKFVPRLTLPKRLTLSATKKRWFSYNAKSDTLAGKVGRGAYFLRKHPPRETTFRWCFAKLRTFATRSYLEKGSRIEELQLAD